MGYVGVDVSKAALSCFMSGEPREFANTPEGRESLLAWCGAGSLLAMESTGRWHTGLADLAHSRGVRCAVVEPGRARDYLRFASHRGKTDAMDAQALARMAEREGDGLRPYSPAPPQVRAALDAMARRRSLVKARVALEQCAREAGDPDGSMAASVAALRGSERAEAGRVRSWLRGYPGYSLLQTVPGVGPACAAALVCALERGEFATSDSLVAFAGLDPRPSESGAHKGRRRVSRRGDAELRTLMFMAARSGARTGAWRPYYEAQLAKGLSKTEATVVLSRKVLRACWSVHKNQSPFVDRQGVDTGT
jgi:transposase